MNREKLSSGYLRSILDYSPETGEFRWKRRSSCLKNWNNRYVGTIAGKKTTNRYGKRKLELGYSVICIDYVPFLSHRLAWLWMMGAWPKLEIDHIDGNSRNNKWSNLREVTRSQNHFNKKIQSNNTSGYKGVMWDKTRNRWSSVIKINGKNIYLGGFKDLTSAVKARLDGEKKYIDSFMRGAHSETSSAS